MEFIRYREEHLLNIIVGVCSQPGVWEALLAALEVLIRADHPQQMFNVKQLLRARAVHHFLLTCQVLQVLSRSFTLGGVFCSGFCLVTQYYGLKFLSMEFSSFLLLSFPGALLSANSPGVFQPLPLIV